MCFWRTDWLSSFRHYQQCPVRASVCLLAGNFWKCCMVIRAGLQNGAKMVIVMCEHGRISWWCDGELVSLKGLSGKLMQMRKIQQKAIRQITGNDDGVVTKRQWGTSDGWFECFWLRTDKNRDESYWWTWCTITETTFGESEWGNPAAHHQATIRGYNFAFPLCCYSSTALMPSGRRFGKGFSSSNI